MTGERAASAYISIPPNQTPIKKELRFPITPKTDAWLASPSRSWEEIDTTLEQRLLVIQQSFEGERVGKIAKSYGIEKTSSGNVARFTAYVELMDEYRLVREMYERRSQTYRNNFEKKREQFKGNIARRGRGQKRKELREDFVKQQNPQILQAIRKATEIKRVEAVILQKAVMDFFSVSDNVGLPQIPIGLQQFQKLIMAAKSQLDENGSDFLKKRKPIDYFILSLTNYLLRTDDKGLFNRYRYKSSNGLVSKKQDSEVLGLLLQYAHSSSTLQLDKQTAQLLNGLGSSFIRFLQRRASAQNANIGEHYPQISLLYDILTAAFISGSPHLIRNTISSIDQHFDDSLRSQQGRSEMKRFISRWREKAIPFYDHFVTKSLEKSFQPTLVEEVNQDIIEKRQIYTATPEFRAYMGLNFLRSILISKVIPQLEITKMRALEAFGDITDEILGGHSLTGLSIATENKIDALLAIVSLSGDALEQDIEVTLYSLLMVYRGEDIQRQIINNSRAERINELHRYLVDLKAKHIDDITKESLFFSAYTNEFYMVEVRSSDMVERENEYLWNQVLNCPIWFVSPRGDRFRQEHDQQLAEYGIESATFYPDNTHPREHKLKIKFEGIDSPFEFWLDTNQNVLGFHRQVLLSDARLRQSFLNLILKRLYYITSGLSAEESEKKFGEGVRQLPFMYRRAHYRTLISTLDRPLTMESHSALVHAEEIKQIYGIDIFAEMKRRRALGTLQPNEYLTFVKEVVPEEVSALVLPNDLVFDSSLLNIQ